jgi:hypothetical protein
MGEEEHTSVEHCPTAFANFSIGRARVAAADAAGGDIFVGASDAKSSDFVNWASARSEVTWLTFTST